MEDRAKAEIIEYARKRLRENVAQTELQKELMERWPNRINDESVAVTFIVMARQAIQAQPKIYEMTCPTCGGMPSQRPRCSTCFGEGTILVSQVPRDPK